MRLYNVEIFDRNINYVTNTSINEINIREDYLDPESWDLDLIDVQAKDIDKNYFVRVYRDKEEYIGIISSWEEKKEGLLRVTIAEIPSIFNVDVLIDVKDFDYSFEEYIKKIIKQIFVDGDDSQYVPFELSVSSETDSWSIEYEIENEPEEDEPQPPMEVAFINLFDDVILPAFTAHQIRLDYSVDINNKKIHVDIGKNNANEIYIEADLENIIDKSVTIRKNTNETNKVIVYDQEDYRNSITYYLHPDDSFDEVDADRITPVAYKLLKAKKETDKDDEGEEIITKTFEESAREKAQETFRRNKYTNLIKLNVISDDELIKPYALKNGQVVSIVSDGVVYKSILSGKEVSNTTNLIFGTIRLELTKLLKGRG